MIEASTKAADAAFDRIIVIVTRQIGDVLLTTPLIRAAKQRWPNARIDVLGFAGTLGMLRGNPDIGETIEVQPGSGWRQSWPLIRRLWRRYDLALIAQYTDRAHLYGWIAARVRSGQVPDERRAWWKRALLKHAVVLRAQSHVLIDKMRLLEPWTGVEEATVIAPPAAALPAAIADALCAPYVVLQVPSLVRYKQWPIAHYVSLVRSLVDEGVQVVLTGGPAPGDRAMVAEVAQVAPPPRLLDITGQLDLNQMSTLLRDANVYVGPDTSITHLAAACGIPVVALYGPIDPRLWGPWPQGSPLVAPYERRAMRQRARNVILLQGSPACVPCNGAGCDRHNDSRSECLETMDPQRVLDEVHRALEGGH